MSDQACTVRGAESFIHPFEALQIDPDAQDIDDRLINRQRKRMLADIETNEGNSQITREVIKSAADSLLSSDDRSAYIDLWNDEAMLMFMRTSQATWAKRIRGQAYYQRWSNSLLRSLESSIRRAARKCLTDDDGDGITALHGLSRDNKIPPAVNVLDVISSECLSDLRQLDALESRLEEGHEAPNDGFAKSVTGLVKCRFYNALPEDLSDLRAKMARKVRQIAITCYNDFDEATVSNEILSSIVDLSQPASFKEQFNKDLSTIQSAVKTERLLEKYKRELDICGNLSDQISELPSGDVQTIDVVNHKVSRIRDIASSLEGEARDLVWDRCAMSIRHVSVDAWNKHNNPMISLSLIDIALGVQCSEETKELIRMDLGTCCAVTIDGPCKLLEIATDKIGEMWQTALARGDQGIKALLLMGRQVLGADLEEKVLEIAHSTRSME